MTTNCSTKTPTGGCSWDSFLSCTATSPLPIVDDSVLQNLVASNGGSSTGSNYSLCYGVAVLKARRFIYYKQSPGDCGSTATDIGGQTVAELAAAGGLKAGAALDPEPISKTILSGISTALGIFGGAHAAAVVNEETTLCKFSVTFNQYAQMIEEAVSQGQLTPTQASAVMQQVATNTDPMLASVAKTSGDFAAVFRIVLRAYAQFADQYVYPYLYAQGPGAITQVASTGAPGTSGTFEPTTSPALAAAAGAGGLTGGVQTMPNTSITQGGSPAVPGITYYGRQSDGAVFRLQNGGLYWGDTWQEICQNLFGPGCNLDVSGTLLGCGPCGGGNWTEHVQWVNTLPNYPIIVDVSGTPISAASVAAQSPASITGLFPEGGSSMLVIGAIILAAILFSRGGSKSA